MNCRKTVFKQRRLCIKLRAGSRLAIGVVVASRRLLSATIMAAITRHSQHSCVAYVHNNNVAYRRQNTAVVNSAQGSNTTMNAVIFITVTFTNKPLEFG